MLPNPRSWFSSKRAFDLIVRKSWSQGGTRVEGIRWGLASARGRCMARLCTSLGGPALAIALVLLGGMLRGAVAPVDDGMAVAAAAAAGSRGGLIVHLGCGDGALVTALGRVEGRLLHGLDADPEQIASARARIRAAGLAERASVETWAEPFLPYSDDLVNLIVVSSAGRIPAAETLRVLAPGGALLSRQGGAWITEVKPQTAGTDAWPQALFDASNNAVSNDTVVGSPFHLQWVASPRNARHHEHLASISVVVSAGGRLVSITDEAPTGSILLAPQWQVVALDAHNGLELWRRPMDTWENHLRGFRSGPTTLARRLVATADSIYVTLGLHAPLSQLDAATGEVVRTYVDTGGTDEILLADGALYLTCKEAAPPARKGGPATPPQTVLRLHAESGRTVWSRRDLAPLPMSLTVLDERVFLMDLTGIICLDAETGQDLWRTPRAIVPVRPGWSSPTVVASGGVLLVADRRPGPFTPLDESTGKNVARWLAEEGWQGDLVAYAADTGKELWRCPCAETYHAAFDVFVAAGAVWVGRSRSRTGPDFTEGRDLYTGEVIRHLAPDRAFDTTMPHHRCHRNRATQNYLVLGRTGVEFVDLASGEAFRHHWVRGVCQYGVVPANGLLYAPSHSCACYIDAKLDGFLALAPQRQIEATPGAPTVRLASAAEGTAWSFDPDPAVEDWSSFRHDPGRSGCSPSNVPTALSTLWQARPGGRLSAPVIADGRVFIASAETQTLYALDAVSGAPLWDVTAGGPVDSPPTVNSGRVFLGSRDGRITCLRAADGEVIWQVRVGPEDRRIVAYGRLESVWPVHGSVLVHDGCVYAAAGRSSYLDGGIEVYRLDARDGEVLTTQRLYDRDTPGQDQPPEVRTFELEGHKPDVLSLQGGTVYMRKTGFDPRTLALRRPEHHLYSPAGFLNGDGWHRTYWVYGRHFYSGYIGWYFAGREVPAGQLLVVSDAAIYGFGYTPGDYRGTTGREYHLFATSKTVPVSQDPPDYEAAQRAYRSTGDGAFRVSYAWSQRLPLLARALVLANDTLFAAGPPGSAARSTAAYTGGKGGLLTAVATEDGRVLAEYGLDGVPVFDGMAAARERLYLSLEDGRLLCLGAPGPGQVGDPLPSRAAALGLPALEVAAEPGLAAYWRFDEGTGDVARDSSGNGHDATAGELWARGEFGTCLRVDGTPGAATIPDGDYLHVGTESFSVVFWVSLDQYDVRLLGKNAYPTAWWVINVLPDGRAELVLGQGRGAGDSMRPVTVRPMPRGTWALLAFVVDRQEGEVRWFIDGEFDSRTPIPPTLTQGFSVEGRSLSVCSSFKPFVGLFDELRIYRQVLPAERIKALHAAGLSRRRSSEFELLD